MSLGPSAGTGKPERPSRSLALPDFQFNPGALKAPGSGHLSPPLSPQSAGTIPSPGRLGGGHGHRRGGSEYVGGSIRDGDTIMSTSPTKAEGGFSSPSFVPPQPVRRSRHAHRRSAAISHHDLSIILQPTNTTGIGRGSSAPTSPADFDREEQPSPMPERALKPVESEPILKRPSAPSATQDDEETAVPEPIAQPPPRPMPRARVGFSETVEFIPRPLSLVSSDTSSTMTARPGHSVSGSISSIVSASTPAALDRETHHQHPVEMGPARERVESRPSTAGAILERQPLEATDKSIQVCSARRRNSIPTLRQADEETVESAEPSPTKTLKRWSFFGLEPFITSNPQNRPRPVSSSSAESAGRPTSSSASSGGEHVSDSALDDAESTLPGSKRGGKKATKKKKKKVKAWAGSILPRRAKPRAKAKIDDGQSSEDGIPATLTHTDIPVPIIAEPPGPSEAASASGDGSDDSTNNATAPSNEENSFPVIDLDAALGPFNTPLPHNPEWEAAQRAAGNNKRQLHSAQGMKGFTGPGMHYHRRAESAPEMVPFEGGKFGIHRFGSSSTMADVFEEEEEDEDGTNSKRKAAPRDLESDASSASTSDGETTPPAVVIATSPSVEGANCNVSVPAHYEADIMPPPIRSIRSEHSTNSLQDEVIHEEPSEVIFQHSNLFSNSPSSSSTPSPRRILAARDLAPVEISPLQLPTMSHVPVSPYSMSHGSSFPSPRSPISIDAQRISTAPSSVNDENSFQSLLLGQPGPEVRISVDDIPSLTSSNSTMTRESGYTPNQYGPHAPFSSQRPASVSSAAFGRRRSSLASLSRLISSSHGERSKLSMEVSCDTESEKKAKISRTKRLSRMVQFWKPKESSSN